MLKDFNLMKTNVVIILFTSCFFAWHCFLLVFWIVPWDKCMKKHIFTFDAAAKRAEN